MTEELTNEEFSEEEIRRNQAIAAKLKSLIEQHGPLDKDVSLIFGEDTAREEHVEITHLVNHPTTIAEYHYDQKPPNLELPLFFFNLYQINPNTRTLTPSKYGLLPYGFIAQDNRFYHYSDFYYFTEDGRAIRVESISSPEGETLEEQIDQTGGDPLDQAPKVDITPKEGNTFTKLAEADYELIDYGLEAIETQKLKFIPHNSYI